MGESESRTITIVLSPCLLAVNFVPASSVLKSVHLVAKVSHNLSHFEGASRFKISASCNAFFSRTNCCSFSRSDCSCSNLAVFLNRSAVAFDQSDILVLLPSHDIVKEQCNSHIISFPFNFCCTTRKGHTYGRSESGPFCASL